MGRAISLGVFFLSLVPTHAWPQDASQANEKVQVDGYGDALPAGAVARLGTERLHHPDVLFSAFAADAKHLATVGRAGSVRVWQVETGKEIRRWQVAKYASSSGAWAPLALSHDGRYLALACYDKSVRLWDINSGKPLVACEADYLNTVVFSPDAKKLAIALKDRVRIQNVPSGDFHLEPNGSKDVKHVAFSADGKTIVTVGHRKASDKVYEILFWDAATGKQTDDHFFEAAHPFGSALSPDGRRLAIPAGKEEPIFLWDTGTGKVVAQTEKAVAHPVSVSFSGDGRHMASVSRDGAMQIWETATGKLLHERETPTDRYGKVALSDDGEIAATVCGAHDDGIHLWKVATGKEVHKLVGHRHGPLVVAFGADGKSALTTTRDSTFSGLPGPGNDWHLRRWDFRSGKELAVWWKGQESEVRHAVFSPDGRLLAVANTTGLLRLFDSTNAKIVKSWQLPTEVATVRTASGSQSATVSRRTILFFPTTEK